MTGTDSDEEEFEDNSLSAVDDDVEIEGFEAEEERAQPLTLDEQARDHLRQIVTQKVDLPISRISQMIDDGEIDLAPSFQRRLRWTRSQKSRLIESVIMNVPIPPVFLGEDEPGQYVVLDGRQRLTALYEFLANRFKLSGLGVWTELNGKRFSQLSNVGKPPVAAAITRRFIPAVLILHESVPEVKYEVFERLNTGGVIAEPMEVRNAIYRGRFNSLLHELTEAEAFRRLWGIPLDDDARRRSGAYKRMADLEMALRFFAFQDYLAFAGSLKTFLNEVMSERNELYKSDPTAEERDRKLFHDTMERVITLLGPNAFHRTTAPGEYSSFPSAPLADAITYAVSRLDQERITIEEGQRIREVLDSLCLDDDVFEKAITVGTNARTAAEYRIETATRAILDLASSEAVP